RFEVRVNRPAYDFILNKGFTVWANLPAGLDDKIEFPEGSIHIKAAWMELPEATRELRERFYTEQVTLVDPDSDGRPLRKQALMAVVGPHIVAKPPRRKDWIWSTFEHVDNLAPTPSGRPASFSSKVPPERYDPRRMHRSPRDFSHPAGRPLMAGRPMSPVEVV